MNMSRKGLSKFNGFSFSERNKGSAKLPTAAQDVDFRDCSKLNSREPMTKAGKWSFSSAQRFGGYF